MLITLLLAAATFVLLLFAGRGFLAWTLALAIFLVGWRIDGVDWNVLWWLLLLGGAAAAVIFGNVDLRRQIVTRRLMPLAKPIMPRIGDTERIALEAGTVWWDGELFSGQPDWDSLLAFEVRGLSEAERAFLEGPVEEICRRVNDWDIAQRRDLSPETWDYLKEHGFFGMIVPTEYGGLGFSARGHSAVVTRLATRSVTLAVTVMVPNSLGPAELILHYGTPEQKQHYLPRLAKGEEIPCFALTGPEAGSDAAATQSTGVVCHGEYMGEQVLGLRLNWKKRYITLAPVATLIGLAFQLRDPDGLLGGEVERGITCALVPSDTPGIEIGHRHDPMGVPFQNGPIVGKDVFIPLDFVIGGAAQVGQGWRMLMESLAAGRSVSLPALSVGAVQLATRVVGAYATIREQFDNPIGRFEGVEEPLARIGGYNYFMTAARTLTCAALDAGEQPAVLSGIVKAYLTEGMRKCINDAMDIRAGAAIMRGPRNVLARAYQALPIGITVEGSNILTRTMIIYGQGAIRSHPFVQTEIEALARDDVEAFDQALFGHLEFIYVNGVRAFLLGLSNGRGADVPLQGRPRRYLQQLERFSAAFAFASDWAMINLGGGLKRREKISGRLADCLAWLYLGSAAIKRFVDDGARDADLPYLSWSCEKALYEIQQALDGLARNMPSRLARWKLRAVTLPLGLRIAPPSDALGAEVARGLLEDRTERERLTSEVFVPPADEPGLGAMEAALDEAVEALAVEAKLRDAVRAGELERAPGQALAENGLAAGIITEAEMRELAEADAARSEVIRVDSFPKDEYAELKG